MLKSRMMSAAASVDIYANGDLLLDDFAFRAATPFVEVPADVRLNIGVAPGSSTSSGDIIATSPITPDSGGSYVAVANGVLDPASIFTVRTRVISMKPAV